MLRMIGDFSSKKLIIYDARPYINALANRLKGAGFENISYYTNAEIKFCEIDNIHAVRDSINKLHSLAMLKDLRENKKYFTLLEQTNWFDFIHQILKSSLEITSSIKNGHTILIHCSDGWDRTSQLTSLSQLILDPYYRTIEVNII
jgi:protein tyrosine phosphatase